MTQRTTLMISAGLTAFVLFVGGAVAGRIAQPAQSPAAAAEETSDMEETSEAIVSGSPEIQIFMQRETAYQELISEANRRLQKAYTKQQATTTVDTSMYAISPDQAIEIALQAAPGASLLRPPALVSLQGVIAYEIAFNTGTVYIDPQSGQVLFNGATRTTPSVASIDTDGKIRKLRDDGSNRVQNDDGGQEHERDDNGGGDDHGESDD